MLVALVGQPNSGKSAILRHLTGARVVTSNYPGTTVELVNGRLRRPHEDVTVVDTPGIYSLNAVTREQEVTRDVLEHGTPDLVVNVVDGSNLARHLSLTLSLLGKELPLLVLVNCADRMRELGMRLDTSRLAGLLGTKVLLASALTGEGIGELREEIVGWTCRNAPEERHTVGRDGRTLNRGTSSDTEIGSCEKDVLHVSSAYLEFDEEDGHGVSYDLQELHRRASALANQVLSQEEPHRIMSPSKGKRRRIGFFERTENALDRPLFAYLGLGISLVAVWRLIAWSLPASENVIRSLLEPIGTHLGRFLSFALPKSLLSPLIAEAFTEGLVLPLAVVLPAMIVAYALIAFLEDTGLLARYAAMGDLLTGMLNLPGQALIPFMLGFGCRVPGLLSARILPSAESRRSASIIIATVVPCTATVSMAWAALAKFGGNPLIPSGALLLSTWLLARVMRFSTGRSKDPLVLELPPLRVPSFRNVAMKTEMRLAGFFTHVLPLVIGMNVAIRLIMAGTGGGLGATLSSFAVRVLGIPPQAFAGVLLTMLQRYLAPLFLLQQNLTPREATIAITMIVLGFPCLPSAITLWREHGPWAVLQTFIASTCLFLGWGVLLNLVLPK